MNSADLEMRSSLIRVCTFAIQTTPFVIPTSSQLDLTLQKQAYSNILKILPPKKLNFSDKNSDIFHIFAQYIDCGYALELPRRGGSNEYPECMF